MLLHDESMKNEQAYTDKPSIILATPHSRNDALDQSVRKRLPDYQVIRLRNNKELTHELLGKIQPHFVFFPHWSWLIPKSIHERFSCVIFHMTDLPYGRGGSPLQNLIIRGHRKTQLTALKCVSEIDAGPIYMKRPLSLEGTAEEILGSASAEMEEMIVEIVRKRPSPVPQQGKVVSFSRCTAEEGDLALLEKLEDVYDVVRMLDADSYPSAYIETKNLRFEFKSAKIVDISMVEAIVRIRKKSDE